MAKPPTTPDEPIVLRCVACERDEVQLELRPGVDDALCIDPVDCRRHWREYGPHGYQPPFRQAA